jgi:hypothetical protein
VGHWLATDRPSTDPTCTGLIEVSDMSTMTSHDTGLERVPRVDRHSAQASTGSFVL